MNKNVILTQDVLSVVINLAIGCRTWNKRDTGFESHHHRLLSGGITILDKLFTPLYCAQANSVFYFFAVGKSSTSLMAVVKAGCFIFFGWQVTLCDPYVRQMTPVRFSAVVIINYLLMILYLCIFKNTKAKKQNFSGHIIITLQCISTIIIIALLYLSSLLWCWSHIAFSKQLSVNFRSRWSFYSRNR